MNNRRRAYEDDDGYGKSTEKLYFLLNLNLYTTLQRIISNINNVGTVFFQIAIIVSVVGSPRTKRSKTVSSH